ncbi:hypothetical protein PVL29_007881 [Vitis rotundifolia]|uniref:Uncharacterized protein n=1 Tax=Vitis rotundifolia TaxID=103349 RepID=A0AA39A352_VITRO|nr:hypothetical protein PVL29_007881 [Vitis rotundifolia]
MGNIEITRELLSLGPGLCLVKDKLGRTPLHWAAVKGRVEIAGGLLYHCYEAVREFGVHKVLVEKLGEDDRDQLINAQDDWLWLRMHSTWAEIMCGGRLEVGQTKICSLGNFQN